MVSYSISSNIDEVVSVFIDFTINSKQNAQFYRRDDNYSCGDWDGLCDHIRDTLLEDIFKLSASATPSESCEWVQVRIDVYILIISIRSKLTHLHGFQQLVLLP